MPAPALSSRRGLPYSHSSLNPKTAAALQQQSHRDGAVLAHQTQCSACPWRCMKRAKRDHAIRAVQGTQLPAELRGSHAEDLPEALPPPVQPFAVILGAGPTGAFMALLLAQQGWRVNVYDSRPRPGNAWDVHTMAHAQNVVLGRRAQLCLARADALEQVEECSVRLLGQVAVGQWGRDTSVRYSFAALSISEPDLADALIRVGQERHPQQIRYHFGHRCTAVDFSSHGANFVDESSSFADLVASSAVFIKKSPPADLLIGADGPRSAMRSAMQSQTPMFGFSQVFSTREVHKALRVCPAGTQMKDESESSLAASSAAPAWCPRRRTGGALQLTQALYTLQRQLDGQPITCQLLPNRNGSFAMSVRGQGLISCSTVSECKRLFETAFPQVVEALGMGTDTYQDFVSAPLCSEPLISCSRYHHNNAVLLGSAAHATFPDMHVSASAGFEDCVSLANALQEHGLDSPAVRRAAQAMTAARRPAALAAARLAAYKATPKDPLSRALSGLRFHVLLACSSSFRSTKLLPWELKLLSSDQDPRLIHSWRSQDALLATVIVVGAAIVITWGSSEISSHVFGSPALSDVLDAAIQSARGAVSSIPRLWAALLAALTEGRRAFAATLQSR